METNIDMFVCAHKQFNTKLVPDTDDFNIIYPTDFKKSKLFKLEHAYSEGFQIYNIWRHKLLDADFVGICHYRRYFDFDGEPIKSAEELFTDADVICTAIKNHASNAVQIKTSLSEEEFNDLLNIVKELYPDYNSAINTFLSDTTLYSYNMFIMRVEDFDKYCKFVFDILFEYDKRKGFKNSEDVYKYVLDNKSKFSDPIGDMVRMFNNEPERDWYSLARLEGHFMERLTHIYFIHNFSRIKTYPIKIVE